ncbi:TIR domain-containing protein [Plesiomonas shigelloides]|uniref:TIR domain-containing protein n=1 Tax=Plesiomonas shigelloides TaxID=703 RepID=UPI00057A30CE|nr:TIR domain-containing protein [Plesiomonas shigelloides]
MARNIQVFISHSWTYNDELVRLRTLLRNRPYFNIEFHEVPITQPINSMNSNYIKQVLTNKIRNSDVVLAISGIYASHSHWMAWEMDKAIELGKPVIGIIPHGAQRISQAVASRENESVRWNTESIVDAIRRHA